MPRAWYTTEKAQTIIKRFIMFFGALAVFWALSLVPFFAPAGHAIQGALYTSSTAVGRAFSRFFAQEDSLSSQLSVCTDRLTRSTVLAAQSEQATNEMLEWRAIVNFEKRTQQKGTAAHIIARGKTPASTVIIDRGENDGIQEGVAVIIGDGILYGTIVSTQKTQSLVRVIEDEESAVSATIQGKTKTIGLVIGKEGAALAMEYIPQDTQIAVGDVVVTSGLGGLMPEGLILGTVESVEAAPSAPFLTATILPVHDPREWTSVLVLQVPGQL